MGELSFDRMRLLAIAEATAGTDQIAIAQGDGAADLIYHALVGLRAEGVGVDAVLRALEERAG